MGSLAASLIGSLADSLISEGPDALTAPPGGAPRPGCSSISGADFGGGNGPSLGAAAVELPGLGAKPVAVAVGPATPGAATVPLAPGLLVG